MAAAPAAAAAAAAGAAAGGAAGAGPQAAAVPSGVKLLLLWCDAAEGARPVSQTAKMLRAAVSTVAVEVPAARAGGKASTAVTMLGSAGGAQQQAHGQQQQRGRELCTVRSWEFPESLLLLLRAEAIVTRVDASLQTVVEGGDVFAKKLRARFDGTVHTAGDFTVRVLEAWLNDREEASGVVIELVYEPLATVASAAAVLSEYSDTLRQVINAPGTGLAGKLLAVQPHHGSYKLPPTYSYEHLCIQYVQAFSLIVRNAASSSSAGHAKAAASGRGGQRAPR